MWWDAISLKGSLELRKTRWTAGWYVPTSRGCVCAECRGVWYHPHCQNCIPLSSSLPPFLSLSAQVKSTGHGTLPESERWKGTHLPCARVGGLGGGVWPQAVITHFWASASHLRTKGVNIETVIKVIMTNMYWALPCAKYHFKHYKCFDSFNHNNLWGGYNYISILQVQKL